MAKDMQYHFYFRGERQELTKAQFQKLYDYLRPALSDPEIKALDAAMSPDSKHDTVSLMLDPHNEDGYKEIVSKILS